jgi:hypothetical protein
MKLSSPYDARLDTIACVRAIEHGDAAGLRAILVTGDPLSITLQALRLSHVLVRRDGGAIAVDLVLDSLLHADEEGMW